MTGRPEVVELLRKAAGMVAEGHVLLSEGQSTTQHAYREMTKALNVVTLLLAQPAAEEAMSGLLDATDRALLEAYLGGAARTTLDRALGITRREVNSRLKRLHDLAGTQTPFQLGAAAARFGWLGHRHPD